MKIKGYINYVFPAHFDTETKEVEDMTPEWAMPLFDIVMHVYAVFSELCGVEPMFCLSFYGKNRKLLDAYAKENGSEVL